MGDRLFSNNDVEAATKVRAFARIIAREPERYGIRADDAQALLRGSNYSVSVRDAQYEYRDRSTALPDAGDAPQRRLEGPAESEAA